MQAQAPPSLQQQRTAWTDTASDEERRAAASFYDEEVVNWALRPVVPLTLKQMLELGREAW